MDKGNLHNNSIIILCQNVELHATQVCASTRDPGSLLPFPVSDCSNAAISEVIIYR